MGLGCDVFGEQEEDGAFTISDGVKQQVILVLFVASRC